MMAQVLPSIPPLHPSSRGGGDYTMKGNMPKTLSMSCSGGPSSAYVK